MTDKEKLDKLVAEIERRYNERDGLGDNIRANVYKSLLSFIAPLQKEPKECMYSKGNYTAEDRKVLCESCEEECEFNKKEESINNGLDLGCGVIWKNEEPASEIDFEQELYKAFGQVKDFTLGMRIAKWFYDMGKKNQEHVSDTQSPVIFYGLTGSVSSPKEEHVSEDLLNKTQTITYKGEVYTRCYKDKLDEFACKYHMSVPKSPKRYAKYSDVDLTIAVKAGAQWQKEQFEKERLKHCDALTEEQAQIESDFVTQHLKKNNRTPTFIDAIKYGIRLKEEQMMKDAVEATLLENNMIRQKKTTHPLHVGDKVKLVIIKED